MRYSPLLAGKRSAWTLYDQKFGWRTRPKIATTPFRFRLHVQMPDHIQKVIWLTGRWEPRITEFFRATLAPGDIFVDVGANIGYYSMLASRIVGDGGHVYAIEGSPTIVALLRDNVTLNHATNVDAIHAIACERDGDQEFFASWGHNLGLSTAVESRGRANRMRSEGRVHCGRLTTIVPEKQLLCARLIKIDVEGGERSVLEPLLERLPEFSDRTVWTVELSPEFSPGGQADIDYVFNAFCAHGYSAFAIRNDYSLEMYLSRPRSAEMKRISTPPSAQTDVVFLRQ